MPTTSQIALPPPQDFSEFENLCCDLWKRIWNDPAAQRNGRRGQRQHGVDVFGHHEGRPVGLQCKSKDELTGSKLTIGEIARVAVEAEGFQPSLSCFTVTTTGLRDATLQEEVRKLSETRRAQGKFPITVRFWDDIRTDLGRHDDLLRQYYPQSFPPADAPSIRVPPRKEIEDYRKLLLAELERKLDPWIDLSVTRAGECSSVDEIRACIDRGEPFVVVGPSGAGKSHLIKHLVRNAIRRGGLAIVARAKHFDGSLPSLLDEAVSHLTPCGAAELLRGGEALGTPAVVLVDGVNEVEWHATEAIVNGLLAIGVRHQGVSFGVTSREKSGQLERLDAPPFVITLPDEGQQEKLRRAYAVPQKTLEQWSGLLRSPLDFKLAGDIARMSASAPFNEYGFLHTYIREKIRVRADDGFGFLTHLAGMMAKRLTWALPRSEVLRIARGTVEGEALVSHLVGSAVLAESPRHVSFWHERFQHFFTAECLLESSRDVKELTAEIARPRYKDALPLLLGAIEDTESLRACFDAANSQELLGGGLMGELGATAGALLDGEAKRVLIDANREIDRLRIVSFSSKPFDWPRIETVGTSEWTRLDLGLLSILGQWIRTGRYFAQFFRLLQRSEAECVRQLEERFPDAADTAYEVTFRYLAVFASDSSPAVATLLKSVSSSFHSGSRWSGVAKDELIARLGAVESQTPIVLYVLCSFLRDAMWENSGSIDAAFAPRLLRTCRNWKIYHLDLEAAELAQQISRALPEEIAREVVEELEAWLGDNGSLNGMTLEAISSYKPLEITTVERAADEVRALLARTPTPESNARAAGIFYLQFEDVFEGVYYEALGELSQEESLDFYSRAALGADRDSLFGTSILLRLVEHDSPKAKDALMRWVKPPPKTNLYTGSLGGGFVLAHLGLARLREALPGYPTTGSDEAAWREWGEILYWIHRADLPEEERKAKCRKAWGKLSGELLRAAVDPWYWIVRGAQEMGRLEPLGFVPIASIFPQELRVLLEEGLQLGQELTSIFDHLRVEDRIRAIISCLGTIGNEATAVALERWCDSGEFGVDAMKVLRTIRGA
jgi:energy-coupling factor transporter ATP-binding protein EcfA2